MKTLSYLLTAALCLGMTACMDKDYDEPDFSNGAPYGNNNIEATNVVTIKQLKEKYKTPMTTDFRDGDSFQEVTENCQIRGYVTANDVSGNIYNEVAIQDETGAILIEIQQGGLYGYLPVGAEILVELKGLCVGNYRMQPQIGMPSKVSQGNNAGKDQLGKISRKLWQDHFRITGNTMIIEPEVFVEGQTRADWNALDDGGKLARMVNVTFNKGNYYNGTTNVPLPYDDNAQFANPELNTSVSWFFNGLPQTVMLYNSNFSDFAAVKLPKGMVTITGILKRYNDSWEMVMRDINDISTFSVVDNNF
ncbi:MAG: hypothetical protein IKQ12_03895 [Prevotella sp.]|jgi:hypothetical protein|nr:hypothetical protein [Prevotella sp.]MBR4601552.1 hypothetical protein [Prevotella sp.]MBR6138696.1 hypothetical protein [Prevotella sp.]MDO4979929.1 DUF5689 domain-containing protein [Prevotellaceae bacterium]